MVIHSRRRGNKIITPKVEPKKTVPKKEQSIIVEPVIEEEKKVNIKKKQPKFLEDISEDEE